MQRPKHWLLRTLWGRRLRRIAARLGFERDWYLVLVAAGIGLFMGAAATAFILPLRKIEEWFDHTDRDVLLWVVPLAPMLGALIAGLVVHYIARYVTGPGVSAVMYAIHRDKAAIPIRVAARKWLAATATIGSGGSAGAEGPIVTIGAAIGSNFGRWLGTNPQNTATLLGCGAAAGISSVFNAPIAGIFFVLEILLRDFSLRTFTPIVIASVISAAFTEFLLGDTEALFAVKSDFFIEVFTISEIPNYLMLGITCGVVGAVFIRGVYITMDFFARLRVHPVFRPVIGAALLGVLGLLYLLLDRQTSQVPEFYGNGYPAVRSLLDRSFYLDDAGQLKSAGYLLLGLVSLAILKPMATCLTIGSGGSGGFFAPSLLIGAAVGGAFGTVVAALHWGDAASPAQYAVVGMAAMVAAVLHAPLTAILIVYEITQTYEIILPLMFAAVISTVSARLISRQSMYTRQLARLGVRVGAATDLTILRRLSVEDVPMLPPIQVRPDESGQRLLELTEQHAVGDVVVVDEHDHYVGMVTHSDLRAALVYREAIPLLQVHELQRSDLPRVSMHETLDVVLDKFSRHDVHSLAVVDESSGAVRGLITRSSLMQRYQAALQRDH